jgi:hypothetical protein
MVHTFRMQGKQRAVRCRPHTPATMQSSVGDTWREVLEKRSKHFGMEIDMLLIGKPEGDDSLDPFVVVYTEDNGVYYDIDHEHIEDKEAYANYLDSVAVWFFDNADSFHRDDGDDDAEYTNQSCHFVYSANNTPHELRFIAPGSHAHLL